MARYIDAEKLETNVRADANYICVGDKQITIQHIISAPPEDVRPVVRGKWIKNSWEICYTCTHCLKTNSSGVKYPFCPNCGAEMESEE